MEGHGVIGSTMDSGWIVEGSGGLSLNRGRKRFYPVSDSPGHDFPLPNTEQGGVRRNTLCVFIGTVVPVSQFLPPIGKQT